MTTTTDIDTERVEALSGRIFMAGLEALELLTSSSVCGSACTPRWLTRDHSPPANSRERPASPNGTHGSGWSSRP